MVSEVAEYSPNAVSHTSETGRPKQVRLLVDSAGNLRIAGGIASGAVDSGNPVKVGGVYLATLPTYTDTHRVNLVLGLNGQIGIEGTGTAADSANASPALFRTHASAVDRPLATMPLLFNGSTGDRVRNNNEATLLASAARTATTNTADQTNYNGRGVVLHLNVTVEGAATLDIKIQGKDPISGNYYDITANIVAYTAATDAPTITRSFYFMPGIITADFAGVAATVNGSTGKSVAVPRTWRAVITHADATTTTYSLAVTTFGI